MKRMKEILSHFHIRSLLKALVWTILLSFAYNIAYIAMGNISDGRLYYGAQIVLSLLSSIGFYKICTLAWTPKKEKLTFEVLLRVLIFQGIEILLVSAILVPLAAVFASNMIVSVIVQLVSAAILIFIIPVQLLYYYALFLQKTTWKEIRQFIQTVFRSHYRSILNAYCALLLLVMAVDTFTGGPFSLAQGFYVPGVLSNLLYCGNPLFSWMYVLYLTAAFSLPLSSMFAVLFFLFVIGCMYAYLDLNYVGYIQEVCTDRGTKRSKAHR